MENKAIIALDHLKQLISADEIGGLSQDPSRSWDRTRILKDIVAAIEGCAEASGGSGGGSPLIIRCTVSDNEFVLSEDWDTINEAFTEAGRPVLIEFFNSGTKSSSTYTYRLVTEVGSVDTTREAKSSSGDDYFVVCTDLSNVDFNFKYIFHSDTSSGTLSCSEALPIDGGGGSGGGVLVVHDVDGTLDKTWQEIHDADLAVWKCTVGENWVEPAYVTYIGIPTVGTYEIVFCGYDGAELTPSVFDTDSPDGYPVYNDHK